MPCFTPLKAFRQVDGGVTFNDKSSSAVPLELACGQCRGCRAERARQWAVRCVHEASMHTRPVGDSEIKAGAVPGSRVSCNSFVTLTYHPSKLPLDLSLDVSHWQKFAKRVRKELGPFRFFHCGEYGGETRRPHYHACLFGLDFIDDRVYLKGDADKRLYTSPTLERLWGYGMVSIGNLDYESAAYVARYVSKKMTGPLAEGHYLRVNDDGEVWSVRPEYCTMSRRPGIGSTWFDRFMSDVYPADEVIHKGKKHLPPKFYDNKLPESELEFYKAKRRAAAKMRSAELTPQRLRVRENIAERRALDFERRGL